MRFQSLILILIVLFALATTNQATFVDINDSEVIKVATFAVTEYNKQHTKAKLKFEKVINGISNLGNNVTIINYRLTLSANNGSASNNYPAIVLDKSSEIFSLIAFALISHA
ncbi:cystatin domain protein [Medicago truncatula]|uniref:Cystatin domain protein n=1 Tax=Medicago truncatula TaxID=3880 RepID=Q2HSS9_MEDTR|nr:Proteinase inhibitor I25A and I25B, type 2 and phytocystatins [Medicago truncatula]AES64680.2 cystatin domain protein [Medicago truncatula]